MSNPKDEVMKMIAKKQKQSAAYRMKTAQKMGPYNIIAEFIRGMEKVVTESKNSLEFDAGLDREAALLDSRMKAIDPEVNLQVIWNNEVNADNWKDLQAEGVLIKWSRFYLSKHNLEPAEKLIDIGSLFMQGLLD